MSVCLAACFECLDQFQPWHARRSWCSFVSAELSQEGNVLSSSHRCIVLSSSHRCIVCCHVFNILFLLPRAPRGPDSHSQSYALICLTTEDLTVITSVRQLSSSQRNSDRTPFVVCQPSRKPASWGAATHAVCDRKQDQSTSCASVG